MASTVLNTELCPEEIQRSLGVGPLDKKKLPRPIFVKFCHTSPKFAKLQPIFYLQEKKLKESS